MIGSDSSQSTTVIGNRLDSRFALDAENYANSGSAIGSTVYTAPTSFPLLPSAQTDGPSDQPPHPPHWPPQHEHRGSIGSASGLEAAHKIDPHYDTGGESMHYAGLTHAHRHRGSVGGGLSGLQPAEKLDPPVQEREQEQEQEQEQEHPGFGNSSESSAPQWGLGYRCLQEESGHDASPNNDDVDVDLTRRFSHSSSHPPPTTATTTATATATRPEKRRTASAPKREAGDWAEGDGSHGAGAGTGVSAGAEAKSARQSEFLNLLDPSVDRRAVKR